MPALHFQVNYIPEIKKWRWRLSDDFEYDVTHERFQAMVLYAQLVHERQTCNHQPELSITPTETGYQWTVTRIGEELFEGQHREAGRSFKTHGSIKFSTNREQSKSLVGYLTKLAEYKPKG